MLVYLLSMKIHSLFGILECLDFVAFLSPCCEYHYHGCMLSCSVMSDCLSCVVTLWTVAHQDPFSMGFSRQEYWSGLSLLGISLSGVHLSEMPVTEDYNFDLHCRSSL